MTVTFSTNRNQTEILLVPVAAITDIRVLVAHAQDLPTFGAGACTCGQWRLTVLADLLLHLCCRALRRRVRCVRHRHLYGR